MTSTAIPCGTREYQNFDASRAKPSARRRNHYDPDAAAPGSDVRKTMTDELTEFRTLASGVGGNNNLGGFILDYKASFAYTEHHVPWNYGYSFDDPTPTGSLTYNNTTNNGNIPAFNNSGLNGTDTLRPIFIYRGASNSTSTYQVTQYGGKADGKFDIPLGGDDASTVKFGAAMRLEYATYTGESFNSTQTAAGTTLTMSAVSGYPQLQLLSPAISITWDHFQP